MRPRLLLILLQLLRLPLCMRLCLHMRMCLCLRLRLQRLPWRRQLRGMSRHAPHVQVVPAAILQGGLTRRR